jgi:importin-9
MLENTDIDGRTGLDVLIQTWCENAETFQGFWQTRVSTLALCSLYVSERQSLRELVVKGDIIVKPETKNGAPYYYILVWRRLTSVHDK